MITLILIFVFGVAVLVTIMEFIFSLLHKTYLEYDPIQVCSSIWTWLHYSWNYVGPKEFRRSGDRTPVRHIGVRWFGHVWEQQIEIPMGELRF